MLHTLIFTKLLGEIDYGAMGDFNTAGWVLPPRSVLLSKTSSPAFPAGRGPAIIKGLTQL
jgi:hypothetical protein